MGMPAWPVGFWGAVDCCWLAAGLLAGGAVEVGGFTVLSESLWLAGEFGVGVRIWATVTDLLVGSVASKDFSPKMENEAMARRVVLAASKAAKGWWVFFLGAIWHYRMGGKAGCLGVVWF